MPGDSEDPTARRRAASGTASASGLAVLADYTGGTESKFGCAPLVTPAAVLPGL